MARYVHSQIVFAPLPVIGIGEGMNAIACVIDTVARMQIVLDAVKGESQSASFNGNVLT
jgi:hypothetical protein